VNAVHQNDTSSTHKCMYIIMMTFHSDNTAFCRCKNKHTSVIVVRQATATE